LSIQGGCFQDSCVQCENGECQQCGSGSVLFASRCFNQSVMAYLDCDEGSASDANLVEGGLATLLGLNYTTGVSGDALVFDGDTKLEMKPLNRRVTDFSISAYFKPKSLTQGTFINIDDRFIFSFKAVDALSFQVLVQVDGYDFTCYVATPIKLDEWNKIQVIVKESIIWTGANGFFHMRAFESYHLEGLNLELNFSKWEIGADANGIDGYLDEVIITNEGTDQTSQTQAKSSSSTKFKIWQISLIAVAGGLVVIGGAFAAYKFLFRQKVKEHITSTSNKQNQL